MMLWDFVDEFLSRRHLIIHECDGGIWRERGHQKEEDAD